MVAAVGPVIDQIRTTSFERGLPKLKNFFKMLSGVDFCAELQSLQPEWGDLQIRLQAASTFYS